MDDLLSQQVHYDPTGAPARHGRIRRTPLWKKFLAGFALLVAVTLTGIAGVASFAVHDLTADLEVGGVELDGEPPPPETMNGAFNVLVIGSDSRLGQASAATEDDDGVLNDVNLVIHVNKDHTNATVLSIPRDMIVPIAPCSNGAGGWEGPINNILNEGGIPCIATTVENITGLDIPYAVMLGFDGVVNLSNAVGGVDVCVASTIQDDYQSVYLAPGKHTLSGIEALHFLRARYGIGDGSDLGRISNQQQFLSSLMRKLKSANTLSNPATVYSIAKAVTQNATLSSSLSDINTLLKMANAVKDISLDKITFVQFPVTPGEGDFAERVIPSNEAAYALLYALQNDQPIQLSGETGRGTIATPNATSDAASTATPTPTATATGTVLSPDITGQTANQVTCTIGRTDDEQ